MTTPRDVINAAHRLLGQVQAGDSLPEAAFQDHLSTFNRMIDSWNTERLSIFSTQEQVLMWPQGAAEQTLGPSGDLIGNRPVALDDSTYFRDPSNGVSYGIKIINQQQYNGIAVKTVTSTYPQVIWVNMEMPNVRMTVFPVPTRALEWHFVSIEELTKPAGLSDELVFPPGYERAFVYALAIEIANEFKVNPSRTIINIAMSSKRNIKRINNPEDVMAMPYAIMGTRQRYNIYAGNF